MLKSSAKPAKPWSNPLTPNPFLPLADSVQDGNTWGKRSPKKHKHLLTLVSSTLRPSNNEASRPMTSILVRNNSPSWVISSISYNGYGRWFGCLVWCLGAPLREIIFPTSSTGC